MALSFGGLFGLFVVFWGGWELQQDLANEEARREQRLVGLAQTVATSLDGDVHAQFTRTADMKTQPYADMITRLRNVRQANELAWVGTCARDERGRYYTVLDGGNPPPIPVGYPIFDELALREQVYAGEVRFSPSMDDEWGRWTVAMAPLHNQQGDVVGIVEVMEDAAWQSLYVTGVVQRTLLQTMVVILLSAVFSSFFARRMSRPLQGLTEAALAVAGGNLNRDVAVSTQDEIGTLSQAFNQMVIGLRERKRIRETFGRFVSDEVASRALADGGVSLGGEARSVTILFSDLRGFSAMTMQQTPEETLSTLNRYFSVMTDVILAHEGNVSELLGDGMVVLFGAPVQHENDALRAVLCAVEMQQALGRFNAMSDKTLEMGIGVATGSVVAGNIGSEKRMKYGVVGPPINLAARLESFTVGSQILICEQTHELVKAAVDVGEAKSFRAKGWSTPVTSYPVRAAGTTVAPEETMILSWSSVTMPAVCRPIQGKRLAPSVQPATVLGVTRRHLILKARWPIQVRDQFLLHFGSEDSRIEDVYSLVTEVDEENGEWMATVRITSIPEDSRRRLLQLTNDT